MSQVCTSALARLLTALSAVVLVSDYSSAADAASKQVMLVGTYHLSNPESDLHNVTAVDVLAPARQREIEAVVRALAQFEPNRVAVEWPAQMAQQRFEKYRDGSLPESRNEVVQLGFRLARERGLSSVQGLDVDGDFPFEAVANWARDHGRKAELETMLATAGAEVAKVSALQERTSISGVLRYLNTADSIERSHSFYPRLLTMGAGDEQPGAKLLSAWHSRNLAICARLLQALAPGDRVVVFYGQGHIYLLRQCLQEQPDIRLVDPADQLPGV